MVGDRRKIFGVDVDDVADFLNRQSKCFGAEFDRDRRRAGAEGSRIGLEPPG